MVTWLRQALNICIALLERRRLLEGALMRGQPASPEEATASELDMQLEAEAVSGIAPYTPRLLGLLQIDEASSQGVCSPCAVLHSPKLAISIRT